MRDTQREAEKKQREKQAPCWELNVGLSSGTPGSRPEPKADAQPRSHPGIPNLGSLKRHFNGLWQKAKDSWVGDKRLFYPRHNKQYELYVTPVLAPLIYPLPAKPNGSEVQVGTGSY